MLAQRAKTVEVFMAARKQASKARQAATPYIRRIADDEELRENLWQTYESARQALGRLSNGKSASKQLFDDKKLQKDIKKAAESFRDASVALREAPKRRRRSGGGLGKLLVVGVIGAGAALALSEGLRKKVLDALFGAEEEFEYTSPTTASTTPASGEAAGTTT
jgi:hypothetical protein